MFVVLVIEGPHPIENKGWFGGPNIIEVITVKCKKEATHMEGLEECSVNSEDIKSVCEN